MPQKTVAAKPAQKKRRSPFCSKVMSALKSAEFSQSETRKLERIISEAEERDEILAQGIATVLDLAGLPPDDMDEIVSILRKAHENIAKGEEPFSPDDEKKLEALLRDKVSAAALAGIESTLAKPDEELIGALEQSLEKKSQRTSKLKSTPKKQ